MCVVINEHKLGIIWISRFLVGCIGKKLSVLYIAKILLQPYGYYRNVRYIFTHQFQHSRWYAGLISRHPASDVSYECSMTVIFPIHFLSSAIENSVSITGLFCFYVTMSSPGRALCMCGLVLACVELVEHDSSNVFLRAGTKPSHQSFFPRSGLF